MIFEFYWSKKLIWVFLQFFDSIILSKNNEYRNKEVGPYSILINELITESSLILSITFYFIQKINMNYQKEKNNVVNHIIKKNQNFSNKEIKKHQIFFFFPKTEEKSTQIRIFLIIIFTSLCKVCYALFHYYFSSEKFIDNFVSQIKLSNCAFLIFSIIAIIIFSKFLIDRKIYKHHIFAISSISIISIFLLFINYRIVNMKNKIKLNNLIILCFFNIILNILVGIMYVFYKYLMEIHFVSLHVINFYEGCLISIYLLFIYIYLKITKDFSFKINNSGLYLIISCILQNIINFTVKYIIYIFNEKYAIIPSYLDIIKEIISNFNVNKEEKNEIESIFLYYCLCFSELIIYLILIFFILIFIEVIIIKLFNLEKKTLKYLKNEEEAITMIDLNLNK